MTETTTPTQKDLPHLAQAYYAHHFKCLVCIAAGIRNGQRCPIGAPLWTAYQESDQ